MRRATENILLSRIRSEKLTSSENSLPVVDTEEDERSGFQNKKRKKDVD